MIGSLTPNVVGFARGKHLMAEQHGHFGVGHVLDLSGQIVAERRICGAIGGRAIAGNGVRNRKRQVFGVVARPSASIRRFPSSMRWLATSK